MPPADPATGPTPAPGPAPVPDPGSAPGPALAPGSALAPGPAPGPAPGSSVPDRPVRSAARVRRPWASTLVAGVLLVGAGLAATRLDGPWADAAGDALYAALVVLLVRWAWPGRPCWWHGVVGLVVCWVIELAQATDLPAAAVRAVPVLRYLLGTTFVATDLLAYAAGATACAACVALARRAVGARRAVRA